MEIEVNSVLSACIPEKLSTISSLDDAIKSLQKLEEDLKKYLNDSGMNETSQPKYKNFLHTGAIRFHTRSYYFNSVQQRLIHVYEKFDKMEADELEKTSKQKKRVSQMLNTF